MQGVGQAVDRIVPARRGAVAAAVGDLELIGLIDLLRDLHAEAERAAVAQRAATALVDRELGVDQVAVVLQEPMHAVVRRIRQLLIGRERQDDVAVRLEAFVDVADHVGHEDRRHRLVVDGAAAAEIAVDLLQLERVEIPVLALGLDHVEMRKQQQRAARAGAVQPRHQVAFARPRREHRDIGGRETAGAQPRRHRLRRLHGIAGGIRRVDLDELAIDVEKGLLVTGADFGSANAGKRGDNDGNRQPAACSPDEAKRNPGMLPGGRTFPHCASLHAGYGCGSLRRNAAIVLSDASLAKSSAVGSCGLSRVALTMQRKPMGSPLLARNWCQVMGGTVTRSLVSSDRTSSPTRQCPRPRRISTACMCSCRSSVEKPPAAISK